MKNLFYINIILLLSISCQTQDKPDEEPVNPLNGTWIMTQYFDSTVTNKSIAKYRVQEATWFSIMIDIQQDTIITYGSLFDQCFAIDFTKDTLGILKDMPLQSNWWLIQKDNMLELVQQSNQELRYKRYTFKKDTTFSKYCNRTISIQFI